jgi:excisionase family DNA binding protein
MLTTPAPTTDRLLTVRQVAGLLGVSTRLIFKLRAAGKLPRDLRVGHAVRFAEQDIRAWIAAGCPRREDFERAVAGV